MLDKIINAKSHHGSCNHLPPTYLIMSPDVFEKAKADEEIRMRATTYKDGQAFAIAGLIVAVIATPGVTDILEVK